MMIDNHKSIEEKVFIITNGKPNPSSSRHPRIEVDFHFLIENDISNVSVYALTYNGLDIRELILYRTFNHDYTGVVLYKLTKDALLLLTLMYPTMFEIDTRTEYVEMLLDNEIKELIVPTIGDPHYD